MYLIPILYKYVIYVYGYVCNYLVYVIYYVCKHNLKLNWI